MKRLVALVLVALAGCAGDEPEADLLLRADRLFDGERFHEPGAVLIRDAEIVGVHDEEADAKRTIDLGDATIMPGFIDLHVHSNEFVIARRGVTTVRNLGYPRQLLMPLEDEWPLRVLSAGPIVTAPGGYPIPVYGKTIALEVLGEAHARRAVADLARRGADVIKIALEPGTGWPMLTEDEVGAIVDEAHAHGLPVTAHTTGNRGAELALAGGVDDLAHFPCIALLSETRQELVEREVEVVATLHVLDLLRGVGCTDPVAEARAFVEAGGTLLYGSDIGNPGIPFGIDVTELRMLRRAGLSPDEVLAAGTSRAGEQIGLDPLGKLVEGAPADVIAVAGDAARLPDSVGRPLLVLRGGRFVVDPDDEE